MKPTNWKTRKLVGFMGIACFLIYLWFFVIRIQPSILKSGTSSLVQMIIGMTWFLSILFWLIGIYLVFKKNFDKTAVFGFSATLMGHVFVGHWLYQSGFNLTQAQKTFTLWTCGSFICFVWGLLLFGSSLLTNSRLPRLGIVLWAGGLVLGNSGLGFKWPFSYFIIACGFAWCAVHLLLTPTVKVDTYSKKQKGKQQRFVAIDLLRGTIMVLMAIDHASLYVLKSHPLEVWNMPLTTYFADTGAFFSRFITHFCAPGFFFLMGAGMVLFSASRQKLGWKQLQIIRFFLVRGILLIALEKIIWTPILYGSLELTKFGVLFGLGGAMILGILFINLNKLFLLIIGTAGIILTQLLPQVLMDAHLYFKPLSIMLFVPKSWGDWSNIYPILPWLSISLLGMVLGKELIKKPENAFQNVLVAGFVCLILFAILRINGGFGNFKAPADSTVIGFLNLVKYPPSLTFTLLTIGVNCILVAVFDLVKDRLGPLAKTLQTFGKTALFFYFIHWMLFSTIGTAFYFIRPNIYWLYSVWGLGILLLYPVCKQYLTYKQTTRPGSLWRTV